MNKITESNSLIEWNASACAENGQMVSPTFSWNGRTFFIVKAGTYIQLHIKPELPEPELAVTASGQIIQENGSIQFQIDGVFTNGCTMLQQNTKLGEIVDLRLTLSISQKKQAMESSESDDQLGFETPTFEIRNMASMNSLNIRQTYQPPRYTNGLFKRVFAAAMQYTLANFGIYSLTQKIKIHVTNDLSSHVQAQGIDSILHVYPEYWISTLLQAIEALFFIASTIIINVKMASTPARRMFEMQCLMLGFGCLLYLAAISFGILQYQYLKNPLMFALYLIYSMLSQACLNFGDAVGTIACFLFIVETIPNGEPMGIPISLFLIITRISMFLPAITVHLVDGLTQNLILLLLIAALTLLSTAVILKWFPITNFQVPIIEVEQISQAIALKQSEYTDATKVLSSVESQKGKTAYKKRSWVRLYFYCIFQTLSGYVVTGLTFVSAFVQIYQYYIWSLTSFSSTVNVPSSVASVLLFMEKWTTYFAFFGQIVFSLIAGAILDFNTRRKRQQVLSYMVHYLSCGTILCGATLPLLGFDNVAITVLFFIALFFSMGICHFVTLYASMILFTGGQKLTSCLYYGLLYFGVFFFKLLLLLNGVLPSGMVEFIVIVAALLTPAALQFRLAEQ